MLCGRGPRATSAHAVKCPQLYLTDAPRLVVISSWSGRFKREVFLTPDTTVNEIDPHTFDVVTVRSSSCPTIDVV